MICRVESNLVEAQPVAREREVGTYPAGVCSEGKMLLLPQTRCVDLPPNYSTRERGEGSTGDFKILIRALKDTNSWKTIPVEHLVKA